jgi:hypothetical protein
MATVVQDLRQALRGLIRRVGVISYLLLFLALPRLGFCQSAREQVEREISRTSKTMESINSSSDDWKQFKPDLANLLVRARQAAEGGRLFSALEYLGGVKVNLAGIQSLYGSPKANKLEMKEFQVQWTSVGSELSGLEERYKRGDWASQSLGLRALAESAQIQTRAFYDSSQGFALATEPKDGLFYMGQSKAAIEYALFCQSLQLKGGLSAPALYSMAPEIRRLQDQIIAVYKPPRSVDQHIQFIRINSALKEAGDLEAAHLYAGALYKYLDSLQGFASLDAAKPGPEKADGLRKELSQARERLASGSTDHSIAEIFLQRAEGGLDASRPKDDYASGLQKAQVILEHVIPAYLEALAKPEELLSSPTKAITVTLVRWPYT